MSRNESALGRAESWEVWMPARATLMGKHFPSEWCLRGWAPSPLQVLSPGLPGLSHNTLKTLPAQPLHCHRGRQ